MNIAKELASPLVALSGGLGDIGAAIVRCLAEAGADVAIADLADPEQAASLIAEVEALGRRCFYKPLDVTDSTATGVWFDSIFAHFGRTPNIIIANAAIVTLKPYAELSDAEWFREINVNLNGAYYFANTGTQRLVKAAQPARVVFLGSWAAHAPHRSLPAYSVAKAGLRMLNQTMALELAVHGILVNEIAPGYVDAGLSGRIFAENPAIRDRATASVPIQKLISASDVASQVLYLCSDYAAHITGSTILQDGGLSLMQGPSA